MEIALTIRPRQTRVKQTTRYTDVAVTARSNALAIIAMAVVVGRGFQPRLGGPERAAPHASLVDANITFNRDVAPILWTRCASCHHPDGPAPFSLVTFADAKAHARQIAEVTRRRYMPPWKPDAGSGPFVGERRLSDREIDQLSRWVDEGAAEGDGGDRRAPPAFHGGWQLGVPDLIVTLADYALRADGGDVFRNFVAAIPVDGTRYVRGLEFLPGSRAVHHANIRIDRTSASRARGARAGRGAGRRNAIAHLDQQLGFQLAGSISLRVTGPFAGRNANHDRVRLRQLRRQRAQSTAPGRSRRMGLAIVGRDGRCVAAGDDEIQRRS